MTTDVHDGESPPPSGHATVSALVDQAVRDAMSRDWTVETAGRLLAVAAAGDTVLLGRARVHLLKTTSPQSQIGRRALLTLAYAMAASSSADAT